MSVPLVKLCREEYASGVTIEPVEEAVVSVIEEEAAWRLAACTGWVILLLFLRLEEEAPFTILA